MEDAPRASAKELWLTFIEKWRTDAEEKGSKAAQTYGKAYKSLKTSPFTYSHPCQTIELNGIGPTIVSRLEKDLAAWCRAEGEPMPSRMGEIKELPKEPRTRPPGAVKKAAAGPSAHPKSAVQKSLERVRGRPKIVPVEGLSFDDMSAEDDFAHLSARSNSKAGTSGGGQRLGGQKRKSGCQDEPSGSLPKLSKKTAPVYVPRPRSGAYGILLGLYDRAMSLSEDAWEDTISKSEVIQYSQPFCDSDYTTPSMGTKNAASAIVGPGPGIGQRSNPSGSNSKSFWTAWDGMKTLIQKGYIWQTGHPPRFALTQPGFIAARKMAEQEGLGMAGPERAPARRGAVSSSSSSDPFSSSPPRGAMPAIPRSNESEPISGQSVPGPSRARPVLKLPSPSGPGGPLISSMPFLYVYLTKDAIPRRVMKKSASKLGLDKDMGAAHLIEFPKRLKKHRMVKGSSVQKVEDVARGKESVPGDEGTADEFREPMCRGWIRASAGEFTAPGLGARFEGNDPLPPSPAKAPSSSNEIAQRLESDFDLPDLLLQPDTEEQALKNRTLILPSGPRPAKQIVAKGVSEVISIDSDSDNGGNGPARAIVAFESQVISDSDDEEMEDVRLAPRFPTGGAALNDAATAAASAAIRRTQSTVMPAASSSIKPLQRMKSAPNGPLRPRMSDFVPTKGIESTYHHQIAPVGSSSAFGATAGDMNPGAGPSALGGTNLHAALDTSPSSSWQPPAFSPIVMPSGSYSIHMIVDTREIHNRRVDGAGKHKQRVSFADEMIARGVPCEARALELGDAIWVARRIDGGGAMGDEVVLDFVVERKRLDDLITSITDGRWREQKFRMSSSGLSQVTYVVEDWDVSSVMASWSKQVRTAVCNVQVIDGFFLERTRNAQDSLDYFVRMHKVIVEAHEHVDLHILPDNILARHSYLRLQTHLRRTRPSTPFLTTYEGFQALNSKNGATILRDVWARMLLCVRGISPEKVGELLRVWETPRDLWEAFLAAEIEAEEQGLVVRPQPYSSSAVQEESQASASGTAAKGKKKKEPDHAARLLLFKNIQPVEQRRKIGSALSESVWKVFCSDAYR